MINLQQIFEEHPDVQVSLSFGNGCATFTVKFADRKKSISFSYEELESIRIARAIEQEIIRLCRIVKNTGIREALIEEAQKYKGTVFEKWLLKQAENADRLDPYVIERDLQTIEDIVEGRIPKGSELYNRVMKHVEMDLNAS